MFKSIDTLLKFASALAQQASIQRSVLQLFNKFLDEAQALGYSCPRSHAAHGALSTTCYEEGLQGALWKDGVIGAEGVMLQLMLRFDYKDSHLQSISLRLQAMPLPTQDLPVVPELASLTLPFGNAFVTERQFTPGQLLSVVTLGLRAKCDQHHEGPFREWLETAMSEWGMLEAA